MVLGGSTLSLDLAPTELHGAYLSAFGFFTNVQGVVGPVALAWCVGSGVPGLPTLSFVLMCAFALLRWFHRLRVRWEIRDDIHEAFLRLACAIICFRRLATLDFVRSS